MFAAYVHALRTSERNVRLLLAISAIAGFTVDGGVYSVIFNLYLLRLNFGPEFVGQINAVANLVFAFGSILGGWLGSRYGERRVMLFGMTLVVVAACAVPLTGVMPAAWRANWIMASFILLYFGLTQCFAGTRDHCWNTLDAHIGTVISLRCRSTLTSVPSLPAGCSVGCCRPWPPPCSASR